jgi:hypothetical protein
MICKNCGSQVNEGTKFCESCGAPVQNDSAATAATAPQFSQPVQESADVPVPKKKSKKKFIIIGIIVAVVLILLIAIISSGSSLDDEDYIDVVKTGMPYAYPDQTWGEALDDLCGSSGEWKSFMGTDEDNDDEEVRCVEFNGTVTETDEEIRIQWICDEEPDDDGTIEYELRYIEIDGENYTTDEGMSTFIDYMFVGQYEE